MQKIIILDFGSQTTQLIGRRVRELDTFCEILPYNKFPKDDPTVIGVILSGSPYSVHDPEAFKVDLSASPCWASATVHSSSRTPWADASRRPTPVSTDVPTSRPSIPPIPCSAASSSVRRCGCRMATPSPLSPTASRSSVLRKTSRTPLSTAPQVLRTQQESGLSSSTPRCSIPCRVLSC